MSARGKGKTETPEDQTNLRDRDSLARAFHGKKYEHDDDDDVIEFIFNVVSKLLKK